MSALEDTKRKISALFAKAEGTDNPHEAETFMAKAQALLEKYNLQRSELDPEGHTDPLGVEKHKFTWFVSNSWHGDLLYSVMLFYGCEGVFHTRGNHKSATLVGREAARNTVGVVYPWIVKQVKQQAKALVTTGLETTKSKAERAVAKALTYKVHVQTSTYYSKHEELYGTHAVSVVDETRDYLNKMFPDLDEGRTAKKKAISRAAMEAAKNIDISQAVKQSTPRLT